MRYRFDKRVNPRVYIPSHRVSKTAEIFRAECEARIRGLREDFQTAYNLMSYLDDYVPLHYEDPTRLARIAEADFQTRCGRVVEAWPDLVSTLRKLMALRRNETDEYHELILAEDDISGILLEFVDIDASPLIVVGRERGWISEVDGEEIHCWGTVSEVDRFTSQVCLSHLSQGRRRGWGSRRGMEIISAEKLDCVPEWVRFG